MTTLSANDDKLSNNLLTNAPTVPALSTNTAKPTSNFLYPHLFVKAAFSWSLILINPVTECDVIRTYTIVGLTVPSTTRSENAIDKAANVTETTMAQDTANVTAEGNDTSI